MDTGNLTLRPKTTDSEPRRRHRQHERQHARPPRHARRIRQGPLGIGRERVLPVEGRKEQAHPARFRRHRPLEDGLALAATAKSFWGRWHFSHNGIDQVREFLPDDTIRAWKNGKYDPWGDGIRYEVKGGVLTLFQRHARPETHMLRGDGTLVFINRPYRNAPREKTEN